MQMQIVVTHDFSGLAVIVDKLLVVFGGVAAGMVTSAPAVNGPVVSAELPVGKETVLPAPTVRDAVNASQEVAQESPAPEAQPSRSRGRPKKERAASEMPARDVTDNVPAPGTEVEHHVTAPKHAPVQPAIPGFDEEPVNNTPPTAEEIASFRELALQLVAIKFKNAKGEPASGEQVYLDVRAKHGNPKVVDLTRPVYTALRTDIEAAIKDPAGFAKQLSA